MNVDPSDTAPIQAPLLDESEGFFVSDHREPPQRAKQRRDLVVRPEVAARQLADDERMHLNVVRVEQCDQTPFGTPDVIDPHRRINEHDCGSEADAGEAVPWLSGRCRQVRPDVWPQHAE